MQSMVMHRSVRGLVAGVVLGWGAAAWAQPVLITSPQTINPGQTTITPSAGGGAVSLSTAEITVQGTTLTVNGRHSIASLSMTSSATLVHDAAFTFDYSGGAGTDVVYGTHLIVSGDVSLAGNSMIDLNGRGFPNGQGPGAGANGTVDTQFGGGGGHGGSGGVFQTGSAGGITNGSYAQPAALGSGGGSLFYAVNGQTYAGGAGGGSLRLEVTGTVNITSGQIRANGAPGAPSPQGYSSGGAGGSVWISAASLAGSGPIAANGGGAYGGGGGGRVALVVGAQPYTGTVSALGGSGSGGPGTVYRAVGAQTPELEYRGSGRTELSQPLAVNGNLTVGTGAMLSHAAGNTAGLSVTVSGNANFESGSGVDVTARGYAGGQGPGVGTDGTVDTQFGGGGGHGGSGDVFQSGSLGGLPYGSYAQPTTLGSGGGSLFYAVNGQTYAGGSGGGTARIDVAGTLTVNGIVRSNGDVGVPNPQGYSSAGAGGSVWITAGSLAGTGTIQANGGAGYASGGGGRVAIVAASHPFSGTEQSRGGGGAAGPGTVHSVIGGGTPELAYDGAGTTELGAPLVVAGNLVVRNGAKLSHRAGSAAGMQVTVTGNAAFESGSGVDVTARGSAGGQGTGAGFNGDSATQFGGGGGYGGSGAIFQSGAMGGATYGSYTQPAALGSGGGSLFYSINGQTYAGGRGGGAARIDVSGTLTVNGIVRSNGGDGVPSPQGYSSSGSGGSVWITAGALAGTGSIQANGAAGFGSGGGGRVAIVAAAHPFSGTEQAVGGSPAAGTGTVYRVLGIAVPELIYDGSGTTELSDPLVVAGNLIVRNGAFLSHRPGATAGLTVTVNGDAVFGGGAGIDAGGRGYPGAQGPGAGGSGTAAPGYGGGGGYGGRGGVFGGGAPGGSTYGSMTQPSDLGSGGGTLFYPVNGQFYAGGPGGGAVRLNVVGGLTLNGVVRANGDTGSASPQGYASSGSGGSVWLSAGSVSGTGSISANGAAGFGPGGGGRVAVYSCNFTLPPANVRADAGSATAQPGTVHFATATATIDPSIVCVTGNVVLRVATVGDVPAIQWRRNGVALVDGPTASGAIITGSSTDTLTITNAGGSDDGRYDAFIAGACGGTTSNQAVLTVNSADFNNDGDVGTDADIEDFFACLGGNCCAECDSVDFDGDDDIGTDRDIEVFFRVLAGGGCD